MPASRLIVPTTALPPAAVPARLLLTGFVFALTVMVSVRIAQLPGNLTSIWVANAFAIVLLLRVPLRSLPMAEIGRAHV